MDPLAILTHIESDNYDGLADILNVWRAEVTGWSISPEKYQRVLLSAADFLKVLRARSASRLMTPELPFALWAHRAPLSGIAIAWKDATGYHGWVSRKTKQYTLHSFYYSTQRVRILLKIAEDGEWIQEALPSDMRMGHREFERVHDMFEVFEKEYGVRNITQPPVRTGFMRPFALIDKGITVTMNLLERTIASHVADTARFAEPWRKSGMIIPKNDQ